MTLYKVSKYQGTEVLDGDDDEAVPAIQAGSKNYIYLMIHISDCFLFSSLRSFSLRRLHSIFESQYVVKIKEVPDVFKKNQIYKK